MARLVLVGLPGTGKTTVARALAVTWNCSVVDTDDELATAAGVPAAQFLREHGEAAFRERELEVLRAALGEATVVATGAGIVTTLAARELLANEQTIWLDCDDGELLTRVSDGDRPLLGVDHRGGLAALRAQRTGWYTEVSRERVDADGPLDEVVERVIECANRVAP